MVREPAAMSEKRRKVDDDFRYECGVCKKPVSYYRAFFSEDDKVAYMNKMLRLRICWVCIHRECQSCKSTFETLRCSTSKCGKPTCRGCSQQCRQCLETLCMNCASAYRCIECADGKVLCSRCTVQCAKCKKIRLCSVCALFTMSPAPRRPAQLCDACVQ